MIEAVVDDLIKYTQNNVGRETETDDEQNKFSRLKQAAGERYESHVCEKIRQSPHSRDLPTRKTMDSTYSYNKEYLGRCKEYIKCILS